MDAVFRICFTWNQGGLAVNMETRFYAATVKLSRLLQLVWMRAEENGGGKSWRLNLHQTSMKNQEFLVCCISGSYMSILLVRSVSEVIFAWVGISIHTFNVLLCEQCGSKILPHSRAGPIVEK